MQMETNELITQTRSVASAPGDIIKIIILERRKFCIDAYEKYIKNKMDKRGVSSAEFKAQVISLFYEMQPVIHRDSFSKGDLWNEMTYDDLRELVFNDDVSKVMRGFEWINTWLDAKQYTRIDNRRQYDKTSVEIENRMKRL